MAGKRRYAMPADRGSTFRGGAPTSLPGRDAAPAPSQNRGVPDKIVLVYDLSDYSSQASFDTMFAFWQNAIIANPSLWRNGVAAAQKRLIFRDFVDSTSQSFLTALHIGSE